MPKVLYFYYKKASSKRGQVIVSNHRVVPAARSKSRVTPWSRGGTKRATFSLSILPP